MNPKQVLAQILTDVKLAERKLQKLRDQRAPMEENIKSALRAGDRTRAEKLALRYEQLKQNIERHEAAVASGREQYEAAKVKTRQVQSDLKSARTLGATAKAINGMADSMDMLSEQDGMVRKLEEDAAKADARLEIAMEDADAIEPVARDPEDILREFEER